MGKNTPHMQNLLRELHIHLERFSTCKVDEVDNSVRRRNRLISGQTLQ